MPKGETTINYTLCMACGCCIQACPFSCLQFSRTGLDPYNKQYPELVTGKPVHRLWGMRQRLHHRLYNRHQTLINGERNMKKDSFVVITDAPPMNYLRDFVSLPQDYGTPAYFQRVDIKAIHDTVFNNLNTLDEKVHFTGELKKPQSID